MTSLLLSGEGRPSPRWLVLGALDGVSNDFERDLTKIIETLAAYDDIASVSDALHGVRGWPLSNDGDGLTDLGIPRCHGDLSSVFKMLFVDRLVDNYIVSNGGTTDFVVVRKVQ